MPRGALVFSLVLALAGGVNAVEAPQSKSPTPTIATESDEVALDLEARDRHGHIVADLKPADLKILDEGSPVKINYLGREPNSASPNLVILYLDQLDNAAARNARDTVAKLFKAAPRNPVQYAVFGAARRLKLVQNFTSNEELVKTAVRKITGGATKSSPGRSDLQSQQALLKAGQQRPASQSDSALNLVLLNALRESERANSEQPASPVYSALLGLARAMRDVPGRKTIIFFAEGQPTGPDIADTIRTIVGAANRAGVAIYVVDPNSLDNGVAEGLQASLGMATLATIKAQNPGPGGINTPHDPTPPGMKTMASEQMARIQEEAGSAQQTALERLAKETSGSYISLSQNPKRAFEHMFEDMAAYYRVTYVPPGYIEDGRFRRVVVTPVRKHLKIVSRSGYYALPPRSGNRPFEAALIQILGKASLPNELTFRARLLDCGELPAGNEQTLVLEFPIRQADFVQDAAAHRYSAHLSVLSQIKTSTGTVVEKFSEDVLRRADADLLDGARRETVTITRGFDLPAGQYILETAIMDRTSGKAGASREVVLVSKPAQGPFLSDLMLVRRQLPFNPETDPDEPLRYEKTRILPNISGDVPDEAQQLSFFLLIHPNAASTMRPRLEMELCRNGEQLFRRPLRLNAGSVDAAIPYLASMPSKGLPGGEYLMTAILTQGAEVRERRVSFRIGGAQTLVASFNNALFPIPELPPYVDVKALTVQRADTAERLSIEAADQMLSNARRRALAYLDGLPNFLCVERTSRSTDASSRGRWRHKDDFAELLTYRDKAEHRVMLEVNGHRAGVEDRVDLMGTVSVGEFGGLLAAVFRPEAKARLEWKYTAMVGNSLAQVFSYSVDRGHSDFAITDDSQAKTIAAYHGLIFIDESTNDIRRITLESDDVPDSYAIRGTSIVVDYDYVPIGGHDFLMPVSGTLSVDKGKRGALLNEMQFRDYRKYSAESSVQFN